MSKQLAVLISGVLAGTLSQDTRTSFRYDPDYLSRAGVTPLSLAMPLSEQPYGRMQTLPWLEGLLPDNRAVLERWASQFGVSARNPFALVAKMGRDCPGAVQICPPDEVDDVRNDHGTFKPVSEKEIGQRLRALRQDADAWTVAGERWSLGGAQSKFALTERDGHWYEAFGGAPTTRIIKPGITGFKAQGLNEHVSMTTARKLGLLTAPTRYLEFDGQPAIVVDRYDRITPADPSGPIRRVHQEDMCQALSVPPSKKYETDGGPGGAAISDLLRNRDQNSLWRFAEALAYNYLIGASDAHAKNYSVLLSGDQVRLAPLYDVASSLPYDTDEDSDLRKTAMAIGGQRRYGAISRKNWEKFAQRAGVDLDRLAQRVSEMAEQLPDALEAAIDATPASEQRDELKDRLIGRVMRQAELTAASIRTTDRLGEARPDHSDVDDNDTGDATSPDPASTAGSVHVREHTRNGRPVREFWRSLPSSRNDQ